MISLVKNLKCISRLNIHCYPNCWYKSYITSLKAVIVGKTFISQDWILIEFCIYRQHWVRKFYRHILPKYRQKVCVCVCECVGGGEGVGEEGGVTSPNFKTCFRPYTTSACKSVEAISPKRNTHTEEKKTINMNTPSLSTQAESTPERYPVKMRPTK